MSAKRNISVGLWPTYAYSKIIHSPLSRKANLFVSVVARTGVRMPILCEFKLAPLNKSWLGCYDAIQILYLRSIAINVQETDFTRNSFVIESVLILNEKKLRIDDEQ